MHVWNGVSGASRFHTLRSQQCWIVFSPATPLSRSFAWTGGFASPPHGGFAEVDALLIDTHLWSIRRRLATREANP